MAGRRYLRKGGGERTHQIHVFDLKSEHRAPHRAPFGAARLS